MSKKKIQRAIDHWIETRDNILLISEKSSLEKLWGEFSREENDYREGGETYGYENTEDIHDSMQYISDRWMCAFRIKWILDGLENGKI